MRWIQQRSFAETAFQLNRLRIEQKSHEALVTSVTTNHIPSLADRLREWEAEGVPSNSRRTLKPANWRMP
jgi:hypothetical protein